jgi:hypothetical protein
MNVPRLLVIALCLLALPALTGCAVTYTKPPAAVYHEPPPPPPPPPPDEEFYELNSYGEWIEIHPIGVVWRPHVVRDWRPYIYGHWAWTDWGWTWISYEPFAWAVYHYGYWHFDPVWGWVWIPDYEWRPVRVKWIYYDDYVCWAPLPPPGYRVPDPWVAHTTEVWVVVRTRHFTNYDLHRFRVKPARYKDRYRTTAKVYREPPAIRTIEKYTKRTVHPVKVGVTTHKSGKRNYKKVVLPTSEKKVVEKYKPHVEKRAAKPVTKKSSAYEEKQTRTKRPSRTSTQKKKQTGTKKTSKTKSKTKQ